MKGVIKFVHASGYGYITPDDSDGKNDVHFSVAEFVGTKPTLADMGHAVEWDETTESRRGRHAIRPRFLGGPTSDDGATSAGQRQPNDGEAAQPAQAGADTAPPVTIATVATAVELTDGKLLPAKVSSIAHSPGTQTGTIQEYLEDRGFGYIARPPLAPLWFHISECQCTRPCKGEVVVYEVGTDTQGREVGRAVRRPPTQNATGDVVEWHFDASAREGRGVISPHAGGPQIPFTHHDIVQASGPAGLRKGPRPWHAASYRAILTGGGQRAVDVAIDWRYPLQRFAWLGDEQELVRELKAIALPENWDYRTTKSPWQNEILYNYLHFTFAKLVDEDRDATGGERKIRVRTDIKGRKPLAAFNTGLVDVRYEEVFALFEENDLGRQQKWKFVAFCTPGGRHGTPGSLLANHLSPLPGPAHYFSDASGFRYDPNAPLHPNYDHILIDDRGRFPEGVLKLVATLSPSAAEYTLKRYIDDAIELAKKRTRWNINTAIPHYFPSFRRLDILLPLCLLDPSRVDVALAVQQVDTGYSGNTILPLDWAYKSARLVRRPDSDWLQPSIIDASDVAELE